MTSRTGHRRCGSAERMSAPAPSMSTGNGRGDGSRGGADTWRSRFQLAGRIHTHTLAARPRAFAPRRARAQAATASPSPQAASTFLESSATRNLQPPGTTIVLRVCALRRSGAELAADVLARRTSPTDASPLGRPPMSGRTGATAARDWRTRKPALDRVAPAARSSPGFEGPPPPHRPKDDGLVALLKAAAPARRRGNRGNQQLPSAE